MPLMQSANKAVENTCFHLGGLIGRHAWKFLSFVVVGALLFGFGLTEITLEDDLFALFIAKNSRLFDEVEFVEVHFSQVLLRAQAVIMKDTTGGDDILTYESLEDLLVISNGLRAVQYNHTFDDGRTQVFDLTDLCGREGVPTEFSSFVTFSGMKGLPCERSTPLDCFQEGDYDFNIIPPLLDIDPLLTNRYTTKPSIRNVSVDVLRSTVNQGCDMWAGLPVPENFAFGAVRRDGAGDITGVGSGQLLFTTLGGLAMAQKECQIPCKADCLEDDVTPCVESCIDSGALCSLGCLSIYNDTDPRFNVCANLILVCVGGCLESEICETDPFGEGCEQCQETCFQEARDQNATECVDCTQGCTTTTVDCSELCFTQVGADCEEACVLGCEDQNTTTIDTYDDILLSWESEAINYMAQNRIQDSTRFEYLFTRSVDDLVDEASEGDAALLVGGYLLMFVYSALCLARCDNGLESKLMVGIVGVLLVLVSICGALGVYAGIIGNNFDPTMIQVLPFLALGLGVNNMFVLASMFKYKPGMSPDQMLATSLRKSGPSITLTALTSFLSFVIGTGVPLPAVSNFSLAMSLVMVFNYFILLFGFTSVLALNARRMEAGRMDCLCCMRTDSAPGNGREWYGCAPKFSAIVAKTKSKIFIMFVFAALMVAAIIGATELTTGLPLSDSVPSTSYAAAFLEEREEDFGEFEGGLVVGMDANGNFVQLEYGSNDVLRSILDMEYEFQKSFGVHGLYTINSLSVIDNYLLYINDPLQEDRNWTHPTETYEWLDHFTGNITTLKMPLEELFLESLHTYINADGLTFKNQIEFNMDETTPFDEIRCLRITYFSQDMFNEANIIRHLEESRAIVDATGLPAFPSGLLFEVYSQFLDLDSTILNNLGWVALAMGLSSVIFIMNLQTTAIMLVVIFTTLFQIYGFMHWFGIQLNAVCVVNLIMAAGVTVEYTAHTTRVFLHTSGHKSTRAQKAVQAMAVPLCNSSISTFLGVIPIAFATFPYFRLYFWYFYLLVLFFGLFNGLLLLPTLLSWMGGDPISTDSDLPDGAEAPLVDGENGAIDIKYTKQVDEDEADENTAFAGAGQGNTY